MISRFHIFLAACTAVATTSSLALGVESPDPTLPHIVRGAPLAAVLAALEGVSAATTPPTSRPITRPDGSHALLLTRHAAREIARLVPGCSVDTMDPADKVAWVVPAGNAGAASATSRAVPRDVEDAASDTASAPFVRGLIVRVPVLVDLDPSDADILVAQLRDDARRIHGGEGKLRWALDPSTARVRDAASPRRGVGHLGAQGRVAVTVLLADASSAAALRSAMLTLAGMRESIASVRLEEASSLTPLLANARWVVQSGSSQRRVEYAASRLDGSGVTVAVADSGVDTGHCMFYDPQHPDGVPLGTLDRTYRKIVMYQRDSDGDPVEDSLGHGTMVANAAAGFAAEGLAPAGTNQTLNRGIGGKKSQIAVYQLRVTGDKKLVVPQMESLLSWADDAADASILCGAFGDVQSQFSSYDGNEEDVDRYTHANQDLVVVFAAGNNGKDSARGGLYQTVSPGNAKNAISVGAGINGDHADADPSSVDTLASFSSAGPTPDGRIKPDIVAPGAGVVSASLGGRECAFTRVDGTSVSTGIVAGAATLVKQYFSEGYHPSGRADPAASVVASAPLVKAVLVNGARPLAQTISHGSNPDPTDPDAHGLPNMYQGFGEINLGYSLSFADPAEPSVPPSPFRLIAKDRVPISDGDDAHVYCVNVVATEGAGGPNPTSQVQFRATLAWADPHGDAHATIALINDLDLRVISPEGDVFLGNGELMGSGGVSDPVPDPLNNVERVVAPGPVRAGLWRVVVSAAAIPTGSQAYSLAITAGGSEQTTTGGTCDAAAVACPSDCSNAGKCLPGGICQCEPGRSGLNCHDEAPPLPYNSTLRGLVGVYGWRYFSFNVSDDRRPINIRVAAVGDDPAGPNDPDIDPHVFVRRGNLPTLRAFDVEKRNHEIDDRGAHVTIIENEILEPGAYFVGVYAHCCVSQLLIEVSLEHGEAEDSGSGDDSGSGEDSGNKKGPHGGSKTGLIAAVVVALVCAALFVGLLLWTGKGRHARRKTASRGGPSTPSFSSASSYRPPTAADERREPLIGGVDDD